MAASVGCGSVSGGWAGFGNNFSSASNVRNKDRKKGFRVSCVSSAVDDSFKTLSIHPGASEYEVKKAFRKLALKYHPDVCRESNCVNQFHRIYEAYDVVMNYLKGELESESEYYDNSGSGAMDDSMRGMCEEDWDLWEEWMGWEGAGIRDYSSHINPYI